MPIAISEHVDDTGRNPFRAWFEALDAPAAAAVQTKLDRLSLGNVTSVKSVGSGVHELKVDFGPGFRIYFGWEGRTMILLIGGGSKKRQSADILAAKAVWSRYKQDKAAGEQ